MPKTYNTFTDVSAGSVLTASLYNDVLENIANYRVPPTAIAVRTTASAAYTLGTNISFESATASGGHDTDGIWAAGSPTLLTIQTTGVYLITFNGYVTMASTGGVQTIVIMKGANSMCEMYLPNSGTNHLWSIAHVASLVAGDTLAFRHTNGGSGAATIYGGASNSNTQTRAGITWLGRVS